MVYLIDELYSQSVYDLPGHELEKKIQTALTILRSGVYSTNIGQATDFNNRFSSDPITMEEIKLIIEFLEGFRVTLIKEAYLISHTIGDLQKELNKSLGK